MGVFHAGEQAVQRRAGVEAMANRVGGTIHSTIPDMAQVFLEQQSFAVASSLDRQGRVWASLLLGQPGFLQVLDERTVQIAIDRTPGELLWENLGASAASKQGAELGLLVIDFATRRRMRLNGKAALSERGLLVYAEQVYSNCPKYIQRREFETDTPPHLELPRSYTTEVLSEAHQQWIREADTFFVASASSDGGADASHRGGNPGFVQVVDERTLLWPDYNGNAMFNTLGNIALDPRAGLLFYDFAQGTTLQLTGRAEIIWDEQLVAQFTGAERIVVYKIDGVIERSGSLHHFRFIDYSPFNPA